LLRFKSIRNISSLYKKRSLNSKSVIKLIGSNAVVQFIAFSSTPLLTRLYSPSDFGKFASYLSIITILSVISTLRYELAIVVPKNYKTAKFLVWLCFLLIAITFLLLILLGFFIRSIDFSFLNNKSIIDYYWFVPFGILMSGIVQPLNYFAIREKLFTLISRLQIKQSLTGLFITVFTYKIGFSGLILGQISNVLVGIFGFSSILGKNLITVLPIKKHALKNTLKEYKNYALFSTSSGLINCFGVQLPYVILLITFGSEVLGYLYLAEKILRAPLNLICTSIEKVFLGISPEYFREGRMLKLINKTYMKLLGINCFIGLCLILTVPFVISPIFGSNWENVSRIILIILPMTLVDFTVSTLSISFEIIKRPEDGLKAQIGLTIIRMIPFLIPSIHTDFYKLLIAYSSASSLGYLNYYFILKRSVYLSDKNLKKLFM